MSCSMTQKAISLLLRQSSEEDMEVLLHAQNALKELEKLDPAALTEAEKEARDQMLEEARAVIRFIVGQQLGRVIVVLDAKGSN